MMMERVKIVHESSQAAYDASAALRANIEVSRLSDCFCSRKIFFCTISCCLRRIRAPTRCFVDFGSFALLLDLGGV